MPQGWPGQLDDFVSLHDYDELDFFVTDWESVTGVCYKGEPTDGTVYVMRLNLRTGKWMPLPAGATPAAERGNSAARGLHYNQLIYQVLSHPHPSLPPTHPASSAHNL